jgi:ATP-dependent DNA helicase RecG
VRLLGAMDDQPISVQDLMKRLRLRHRPSFMQAYLNPALAAGLIDMTRPDAPRSSKQQYRLTPRGRSMGQGRGKRS